MFNVKKILFIMILPILSGLKSNGATTTEFTDGYLWIQDSGCQSDRYDNYSFRIQTIFYDSNKNRISNLDLPLFSYYTSSSQNNRSHYINREMCPQLNEFINKQVGHLIPISMKIMIESTTTTITVECGFRHPKTGERSLCRRTVPHQIISIEYQINDLLFTGANI